MTERSALFDPPTQPLARMWRERFARLSATSLPCPGVSGPKWERIHTAALQFLSERAEEAEAKGWTTLELFGVHPAKGMIRVDACGALMVSGGELVREIHPDRIGFGAGSYRRTPGAPASVPVWDYREAR